MQGENEKKSSYTGQTDARRRANAKYLKETVEDIRIRVPKGQKAIIQDAAESVGESLNTYVRNAIEQRMACDTALPAPPTPSQPLPDSQPVPAPAPAPEATDQPQDGILTLVERGVAIEPVRIEAQHLYVEQGSEKAFYVEPVPVEGVEIGPDDNSLPF